MGPETTEPAREPDERPHRSRVLFKGGLVADTQARTLVRADVLVEDERIVQVLPEGTGVREAERVLDVGDCLVLAGFVNTHSRRWHWNEAAPGAETLFPINDGRRGCRRAPRAALPVVLQRRSCLPRITGP